MNNVSIIGRITKDLEIKSSVDGKKYCKFSIAYNEKYSGKDKTYFFNVVSFGKTAEIINQYFNKGERIGVSGKLVSSSYSDDLGNKKQNVEISVNSFSFIENKDSKKSNDPISQNEKAPWNQVEDGGRESNGNWGDRYTDSDEVPF